MVKYNKPFDYFNIKCKYVLILILSTSMLNIKIKPTIFC